MKYKCYKNIQENQLYTNSYRIIIFNEDIEENQPGCISWYIDYYEIQDKNTVLVKEYFQEWPSSGALDLLKGKKTVGNVLELVKEEDFESLPNNIKNEITFLLNH